MLVSCAPPRLRLARFRPQAVGRDRLASPDAKKRARAGRFCTRNGPPRSFVSDPDGPRRPPVGIRTSGFLHGRRVLLARHQFLTVWSNCYGCDQPNRRNCVNLAVSDVRVLFSRNTHKVQTTYILAEMSCSIGQGAMIPARSYVDVWSTGPAKLGPIWHILSAACIWALPWPPSLPIKTCKTCEVVQSYRRR